MSGLRRETALNVFSDCKRILILLANERLTKKQKLILQNIDLIKNRNATSAVNDLSKILNCSKSNVWRDIRLLKRVGIISCSSSVNKGLPIQLTRYGKIILNGLNQIQLNYRRYKNEIK